MLACWEPLGYDACVAINTRPQHPLANPPLTTPTPLSLSHYVTSHISSFTFAKCILLAASNDNIVLFALIHVYGLLPDPPPTKYVLLSHLTTFA